MIREAVEDEGSDLGNQRTTGQITRNHERFGSFIENVFGDDLEAATRRRFQVYEQYSETVKLRRNLQAIKDLMPKTDLEFLVHTGLGTFMAAEVPDPSRVFIETGFGFFVELSLAEAVAFLSTKQAFLLERIRQWEHKSADLKTKIRVMTEALRVASSS